MFDFFKDIFKELYDYLFPFVIVFEYEMGVRLRLGKNPKALSPGFHFKIPLVDMVLKHTVTEETGCVRYLHVTTKDGKTITTAPVVKFIIIDITKWLIYTNDAITNLYDMTRLVTADYLTDLDWEECKQKTHWTKIKNKLNNEVEEMGARVTKFGLSDLCLSRVIVTQI